MIMYSYIEERYCTKCKQNVAIEHWNYEDGTHAEICLNKACENFNEDQVCGFKDS